MSHRNRIGHVVGAGWLLPVLAGLLSACGGGGGTRPDPPPAQPPPVQPPPPAGLDFTPNVGNDGGLAVNPPGVAAPAPAAALPEYSGHLVLTNAAGAIGAGLTGRGVTIGLLDSGVNRNHPALQGRVSRHFVHVNSSANDLSVDDKVGHGTVVAQMAAGRGIGSWGGGVAQGAGIVSSRIIADTRPDDDGSGAGNQIGAGQGYGDYFRQLNAQLADAGARIVNNSWGGLYWKDPRLTAELAGAWRDFVVNRGGIIVFANGNAGRDPRYAGEPSDNARLPTLAGDRALERGWLTVGALDPDNPGQLTDYSQECGSAMHYCLVAPGNTVFVDPQAKAGDARYDLYQGGGTSYAAPQVSGAAAIVWEAFPYFDNDLVRQTLLGTARDLGAPGVDPVFGWGLLDVTRASQGPANFAWGDVRVSFAGDSVWRNRIGGSGALVKDGSGTLTIAEAPVHAGGTRVQGGGLALPQGLGASGLRSDLAIAQAGTVWASSMLHGDVANAGRFLSGSASPASVQGDFSQTASGNLGVWLSGTAMSVSGRATLAGQVSILGMRSGYTTGRRETLLAAGGGIAGTFASLKAAANVFLDASLSYDANSVFLDINRINVANAVAGLGLPAAARLSALRVESAMAGIDGALAGTGPEGLDAAFLDAAGALQQAPDAAGADRALRSLSGQLHAAAVSATVDAADAGRRTLDARLDGLAAPALAAGTAPGPWHRDLSSAGMLARGGYDGVDLDASGDMIGADWRLGGHALLGVAANRLAQSGLLGEFGDRSRGWQRETRLYAAAWHGPWRVQLQLADGRYDRHLQRNLLLGALDDTAASRLSGRYLAFSGDIGRRFGHADAMLMPYLGGQSLRLRDDGFAESGATGFGLRADAWEARGLQAYAGLRAERGWRTLRLHGHAEWQQVLAAEGFAPMASFTGIDSWSPLPQAAALRSGGRFGLELEAALARDARLSFGLAQRFGRRGGGRMASLRWSRAF